MSVITAIALICGLNLGNAQVTHKTIEIVLDKKQECQVKLAQCMDKTKPSFTSESDSLIRCLGKQ